MPAVPKPTALKLLEGNRNHGNGINNKAEPMPTVVLPKAPEWLDSPARRLFNRLAAEYHALGLLTVLDVDGLATVCQAIEDYKRLTLEIRAEGETFTAKNRGGHDYMELNPKLAARNLALQTIIKLGGAFGMTPAARSKLTVSGKDEGSDLMSFIAKAG